MRFQQFFYEFNKNDFVNSHVWKNIKVKKFGNYALIQGVFLSVYQMLSGEIDATLKWNARKYGYLWSN